MLGFEPMTVLAAQVPCGQARAAILAVLEKQTCEI